MKEDRVYQSRHLNDLLEENVYQNDEIERIYELNVELIKPNPNQPRTVFGEGSMNDLMESIREHGLLQPIIVRPEGSRYVLVAGERRLRAIKKLGMTTVPALVRDYNKQHLPELALIENLQREDLTPIEEAIALRMTIKKLGITHAELAKKIGKSRVYVTNTIGLLSLPETVIESVNNGTITMGHARALSKIKNNNIILQIHERILLENLSVRETESLIKGVNSNQEVITKNKINTYDKKLKKRLPKNVKYKLSTRNLIFHFENEEELNQILQLFKGDEN